MRNNILSPLLIVLFELAIGTRVLIVFKAQEWIIQGTILLAVLMVLLIIYTIIYCRINNIKILP